MDSNGNLLSNHLFDSHGMSLSTINTEPFGYGAQFGYYTDTESGLQLLTNRYYDPQDGRFLTRDPIGYNGGINLYAYVENSPIGNVDPSGLEGETEPGFLSLMGSYGKGVGKGVVNGAIGAITLNIKFMLAPVSVGAEVLNDLQFRTMTMASVIAHPIQAKETIIDTIIELGPNQSMEILGDAGGQVIAIKAMGDFGEMAAQGREFYIGENCRVAPFGNRTGHPTGSWPHYHRRIPDPKNPADSLPGQGMKRHRPWDSKPTDKSWRDRF